MMFLNYKSKKELKENIGQPLDYTETSMFGNEYKSDGSFVGCNRPTINPRFAFDIKKPREFFAQVTIKNDLIDSVK
jgi:hypothetical protein|tara:strand:- start:333 stop:560 length:228 start_codon:yes stop_codon:yes gene_type:complete